MKERRNLLWSLIKEYRKHSFEFSLFVPYILSDCLCGINLVWEHIEPVQVYVVSLLKIESPNNSNLICDRHFVDSIITVYHPEVYYL